MLEPVWQVMITGILELSNGCCSLSMIENMDLRFLVCSGMLALGGVCITMQTSSVVQGLSMRYYLLGKLFQFAFSLILGIAWLQKMGWIPVLLAVTFGFISMKTKNTGSNPKKAVV